ncbi:MAG: internalization-related competence protein ComEC/Rec2, competence protein ComEC protein [Candidatus Taylorbacteria bacterium]|nr:internalization-related competence protein ComEC/Rec2, competence protein ComEC protein [Candidatus Taylorbacteria bacterium]
MKIASRRKKIEKIIFVVALLLLGMRFWLFFHHSPPRLPRQNAYIGVIDADPEDKGLMQSFPVAISNSDEIRVLVQTSRYPRYAYGDEIEISGRNLFKPRPIESSNGRSFDYEHFLSKDDIYYQVKNPTVRVISHGKGSIIVASLIWIKRAFLSHITSVLGEPHAALAGGLVVGEKSALGKDLVDDFRRAGLIHIVVLSGFNITIVAAAIRRVLSFSSMPRSAAIITGGICMILFCILVGGGATVVRSCLMGMIALVGELLYRKYQVGRALGIAAYLMLFQNPSILIYDPSFQLSFLATLALILLASPIEGLLERWKIPELLGIRGLIATTMATQILVSPFIFYLMGQISIIGVLVNIVVLPIIPATMFVVTAIGLGGFAWHWIAVAFAVPAHAFLSYELWTVRTAAHLPGAVFAVTSFSFMAMCLTYVGYFCLYLYFRKPKEVEEGALLHTIPEVVE